MADPGVPDFINTHEQGKLAEEFAKVKVPGTKLAALVDVATKAAPDTVADKVKLGGVKRLIRGLVEQRRVTAAAWRWLRPDSIIDIGRLDSLRVTLGLNHLTRAEVAERMSEACRSVADAHPRLARWVDARIADLEYVYKTSRGTDLIDSRFELYQRQLVTGALNSADQGAQAGVQTLVPQSIATAAAELRLTLDENIEPPCPFHANLMMVATIQGRVADVPEALGPLGASAGAREAAELWKGLDGQVHRVLVVVSETTDSQYRGFWIPDVRRDKAALPGAPQALLTGTAQAVIVDDLPRFPSDNKVVEARWRDYLRGDQPGQFQGTMFVSVPLFRVAEGPPMPAAILNVNVVSDRIWKRAYSRNWLHLATRRVAPWASMAWHATALDFEIQRSNLPFEARLEVPAFRRAPERNTRQLPPPSIEDDDEKQ